LRVWKALLNPFRYIGAACGAAAFVRAIGSVYLGSRVIIAKTLAEYREANGWLIRALLISGTSIDVIIAASMLYFLLKKRNSGFSTYVFFVYFQKARNVGLILLKYHPARRPTGGVHSANRLAYKYNRYSCTCYRKCNAFFTLILLSSLP
jgi:hypothetical protein